MYIKSDSFDNIHQHTDCKRIADSAVSFGIKDQKRGTMGKKQSEAFMLQDKSLAKKSQFSFGITTTEQIDDGKLNRLKFRVVPNKNVEFDRSLNTYGKDIKSANLASISHGANLSL